jgi:hypothetical protein
MEEFNMIISREDLERNRRKVLLQDQIKVKAAKKEKALNILGVILMYAAIVVGVLLIDWRMEQIEDTKNTTADTVVMNERVK